MQPGERVLFLTDGTPLAELMAGKLGIVVGRSQDEPRRYMVESASGVLLIVRESMLCTLEPDGPGWNPHVECAHMEGLPMDEAIKWADALETADMMFVYAVARDAIEQARNWQTGQKHSTG